VWLRWDETDWPAREINRITQKRGKRVIAPNRMENGGGLGIRGPKLHNFCTHYGERRPSPIKSAGEPISRILKSTLQNHNLFSINQKSSFCNFHRQILGIQVLPSGMFFKSFFLLFSYRAMRCEQVLRYAALQALLSK
jgi:hypothetical protein